MRQTMEKRATKINLFVLLMTIAPKHFMSCWEVSPQIDFNSGENERGSDDSDLKSSVNFGKVDGHATGVPWISKIPVFRSNGENGFVRSDNFKRSYFTHDDSTKQPKVINNIQIVLNENETKPCTDTCENGVCQVSVSSNRDEEGNIITDVHLRIITRSKTDLVEVNDIPVVDGIRGVENGNQHPPNFQRKNTFQPLAFLNNDIPQIQTRHRGGEAWYQGRNPLQRPENTWRYHSPEEFTVEDFQHHGGWPSIKPAIDDKIEPVVSKTQTSSE